MLCIVFFNHTKVLTRKQVYAAVYLLYIYKFYFFKWTKIFKLQVEF